MGKTHGRQRRPACLARMVALVAGIGAMVLLPAAPAAAETSEPIGLELTASSVNGSPGLAMRVTNTRSEACALVLTPEASLQIVSMTRDGRPVKPSFGAVQYLDGISGTLARTNRVVPAGESVTVQLGAAQPGLRAVAPTPDDEGVVAQWPTGRPGQYTVRAVYSVPTVPDADGPRCAGRSNLASVTFTIGDDEGGRWVVWLIVGGAVVVALGLGVFLVRRSRSRGKRGAQAAVVVALAAGVMVSPVATPQAHAKVNVHLGDFTGEIQDCLTSFRGVDKVIDDILNVMDSPHQIIPIRVVGTMDSRSPQFNDPDHPFFGRGPGDVSTTYDNGATNPQLAGVTVHFDPTLGQAGVEVEDGVPWDNCAELLHQLLTAYITMTDFNAPDECEPAWTSKGKQLEMDDEVKVLLVENLYRKRRGLPEREVPFKLPDFEPEVDPCDKKPERTPVPQPKNPGPPDKPGSDRTPVPQPPPEPGELTPVPKSPSDSKKKNKKPKKPGKPGKPGQPGKRPPKNTGSNGDPHLYTMDGLAYDLQAVGEFVLIAAESGDLQVQARQVPMLDSRTVSVNSAIAVKIGERRVVFEIDEVEDVLVRRDGKAAIPERGEVDLGDGATLTRRPSFDGLSADGYTLRWRDGSRIWVDAISTWGLRLYVDLAPGRTGKVRGLLGDNDGNRTNDLTGRDGRAIKVTSAAGGIEVPPFKPLYQEFGESWRVTKAESLFDYGAGESPEKFVDRTFPDKPVTVQTLPPAERAKAESVCAALGVTQPELVPACVLDVATTGLASFAANADEAQQVIEDSSPAGPVPDTPADLPSTGGDGFGPGDTVTGSVDRGVGKVRHRFTATAGDVAYFDADPACDHDKTPLYWDIRKVADLDRAGGELAIAAICTDLGRVRFTESGTYVVTVGERGQGGTGDYRFTWVPADPDQQRDLGLGDVVSGEFDIGERHVYTFRAAGGDLAYRPSPACTPETRGPGVTWQLFEADNVDEHSSGLQLGFACDEATLSVESGGRYALVFNGIGYQTGGEYSFVVERG